MGKSGKWQPDRNSRFTTWFYRIVVNLCLDWQKKKRPLPLDEEMPLIDERETADEAMIRIQEQTLLEKEIAALPERQRTALNLCFDEGLSNQEAAEAMGRKSQGATVADHARKDHIERTHEGVLMRAFYER